MGALEQLKVLGCGVWRHRWLCAAITWAVCFVGWTLVVLWPQSFAASAVVYADVAQLRALQAAPAADGEAAPAAWLETALLASAPDGLEPAAPLDLEPLAPDVYRLVYRGGDAVQAHRVVDGLLKGFAANGLGPQQRLQALEQALAEARREQASTTAAASEFRRDNAAHFGDTDFAAQQQSERDALDRIARVNAVVRAEAAELARRLAELPAFVAGSDGLAGGDGFATSFPRAQDPALHYAALQADLAGLRERYADSHPYVVTVRAALARLMAGGDAGAEAAGGEPPASGPQPHPLFAQTEQQRVARTNLLAALEVRRSALAQQLADADELARMAGPVQAEWQRLEQRATTADAAVARLQEERDEVAAQVAAIAGGNLFRVSETPVMPTAPEGLPRRVLVLLVLFAGVVAGALAAAVRGAVDGVVATAAELRGHGEVAVLGELARVATADSRRFDGQQRLRFSAACFGLLAVFCTLIVFDSLDLLVPLGYQVRSQILG